MSAHTAGLEPATVADADAAARLTALEAIAPAAPEEVAAAAGGFGRALAAVPAFAAARRSGDPAELTAALAGLAR